MKTRFLALLSASALCALTDGALAHGGRYRGPLDTTPPPGGGRTTGPTGPSAPTTGQPAGPTAPGPSGGSNPSTGGGGVPPTGGSRNPGRSTGIVLDPDVSTWDYWWECNKDAYLHLKDRVHSDAAVTGGDDQFFVGHSRRREETLRPTTDQVQNDVLPALRSAIDGTQQRDITSSCMIAMAKTGRNHAEFRLVDVFRARLARNDQEIRETAALAIGIAARVDNDELELLQALALDAPAGRSACGGEVDARTRAFALYGLGLCGRGDTRLAVKQKAFDTMRTVLADAKASGRDLKVAAVLGIGMLDLGNGNDAERNLRSAAVDCLLGYYDQDLGAGEQILQAHCPTALAKLVGRHGPEAARLKARFAAELGRDDKKRRAADLSRSCALALGQLALPHDDDNSSDAAISKLLGQIRAEHRDHQTRHFATMALGQIGGAANRAMLLGNLRKARSLQKSWVAMALGVMTRDAIDRSGDRTFRDDEVGLQLAAELAAEAEPMAISALAVALGLCRHTDAAPALQKLLLADPQQEEKTGYVALGLGLMDDRTAIEPLAVLMKQSVRRPNVLKQAAVALALLGDKSAARQLEEQLTNEHGNIASFAAAAGALGMIGDRRSIQPIKSLLFDKDRSDLTRAFAAVALGGIADNAPMPWHTAISANLNYRATTETLRNQSTGILDLL